jgi:preprotein translocase subunit SecA
MAKLGTPKRPITVHVQTTERAQEIAAICEAHGWFHITGIEPDNPEDITDLELALNPVLPVKVEPKPGRNDPCPCGSGKKYKKCCGAKK